MDQSYFIEKKGEIIKLYDKNDKNIKEFNPSKEHCPMLGKSSKLPLKTIMDTEAIPMAIKTGAPIKNKANIRITPMSIPVSNIV